MLQPQFAFTDPNAIITNATTFTLTVQTPAGNTQNLSGFFLYGNGSILPGSSINGLSEYTSGGSLIYDISGLSMAIETWAVFVVNSNAAGMRNFIFGGSDGISGSSGNDRLMGLGGNDSINGGSGFDTAVFRGNLSDYSITKSNGQVIVTDLRGIDGSDTLSNMEQLQFANVTISTNSTPIVSGGNYTPGHTAMSVPLTSIVSVSDADGDAVTQIQIFDNTTGGGRFSRSGVLQPENQGIVIDVSDFADCEFVTDGAITDSVSFRAYDGRDWGAWTTFNINPRANALPTISAANLAPGKNDAFIAAANLFGAADGDGDTITRYRFYDATAGNGRFLLNSAAQVELANFEVAATDLANFGFETSPAGASTLWVQAYDGFAWSAWKSFTVAAVANVAPIASVQNLAPGKGTGFIAASGLVTISDPDDANVVRYQFFDGTTGNGRFQLNGNDLAEMQNITVEAADFANFRFRTASSGSDQLWVQAFDGTAWGTWKTFTVSAPTNVAPVVNAQNLAPTKANPFVAGAALFTVSDPDDAAMAKYRFFDGTAGNGRFQVNGTDQIELANIEINASDLANFRYATSATGAGDTLWVQAYDGFDWSAWKSFTVSAPANNAPVVSVANIAPALNTVSIQAQSLFGITDDDGDTITQYRFFDGTAGNGHFVVNGISQVELQNITVNATDLASTSFIVSNRAGTSDTLWVQAFDGTTWSAWKSFTVNDSAPQVRFSVTIDDPQSLMAAYHSAVAGALQAAANLWADHLAGDSRLEIRLRFIDTNGTNRASGSSTIGVNIGTHSGNDLYEEGAGYELRTGTDPNGSAPDIEITATEDYIKTFLWFDPNPSSRTAPVPLDRNDAVSIFVHEIGHALGFNGWVGSAQGVESEYDSHIVVSGGHKYFDGSSATALYGSMVPLTDNAWTHVGNAAGLPGFDLADDTMGGVVAKFGVRTEPTALDLAILNDLGVAVKAGTTQRDVLRIVTATGDTLDGRGGDDLLRGGSGDDTLIGGAGTDTIGFTGARGDYAITKANGVITVDDQRANGDGTDTLSEVEFLQFSDGTVAANRGPTVVVSDLAPGRATTAIAGTSLFSVVDPDGDAMVQYKVFDGTAGNGRFELNGTPLAELQNVIISAADLANLRFRPGTSGNDTLWVQAFDGVAWSSWKSFTVAAPANAAPVVTVNMGGLNPARGTTTIAAASFFSTSDADGDTITQFRFFDGNAGNGHFELNGTPQAELVNITINASDLANFAYRTSATGTGDTLWVQAFDGTSWSAWKSFAVAAPSNIPPVVNVQNITPAAGQSLIAANTLFTVNDPDDTAMVRYRFFDGTIGNGRFQRNGIDQVENQNITVEAADLANFRYATSTAGGDMLWVQAFDGFEWSTWKSFNVAAAPAASGGSGSSLTLISNTDGFVFVIDEPDSGVSIVSIDAPVVFASDTAIAAGATTSVSALLSATDPNGDSIAAWRLWDGTAGGGALRINGVTRPDHQAIEIMASDLASIEFLAGNTPGADQLYARASDGTGWGEWKPFTITTLASA